LEVEYESYLKVKDGLILAVADARGVEVSDAGENRREPIAGQDLYLTLDINIQSYATQLARQVMATKQAERVSIIVLNPQNGEIYAMVDVPEFDLNSPFNLPEDVDTTGMTQDEKQNALNQMWRNACISDTYEPGSTFKIITAAAGLEEGVVSTTAQCHCPGFITVEARRIRCHKVAGHGSETFVQGIMNSCNPVFITVGLRRGVDNFYRYFEQFGLLKKPGIDLPWEAGTIMHKPENMGLVELATVSFGQSFQITPIKMAATAASLVNGGKRITPHLAMYTQSAASGATNLFASGAGEQIVSAETSETLRYLLEQVVAEGTGKNGYVEGYRVGGKTATSQTLPRGSGRYIASFIGFAPANDPQVLALVIIHNPQGIYYGGQVAAPVARTLFENILPYME
ncbi:MAG: peptidoglycan glycosyltransferase, partial [Lachnospiraceae bacterium]|nr:peptidoglycan glycosyltransferase [Lachnospiraceae bacterium]